MTGNAFLDAIAGETGLIQALILLAIAGLAVAKLISMTAKDEFTRRLEIGLFVVALLLRFVVSLGVYEFGFIDIIKDEDGTAWLTGVVLYQDWVHRDLGLFNLLYECTTPFLRPLEVHGYEYLVAVIFYLTDMPARLPAAVVSNICGAATVVVVYRAAAVLFSRWVAVRAAWWTCLMPSMVVWSAQTLKEPAVLLLEALALYSCLTLNRSGFSMARIFQCAFAIVFLLAFRFYAAYIVGGVVVFSLIMPKTGEGRSALSGIMVAAIIVAVMVGSGMMASHLPVLEKYDLGQIQAIRDYTARNTGSGIRIDYDLGTPIGFTMSTLVGGTNLLLAPFPWQLGGASVRLLMTLPEVLVWWWLVFWAVAPGLWWCTRHRLNQCLPIFLFLISMGMLYSISFSNIGLGYRYRATLLPWLFIFAMVGLEQRVMKRTRFRSLVAANLPGNQGEGPSFPRRQFSF